MFTFKNRSEDFYIRKIIFFSMALTLLLTVYTYLSSNMEFFYYCLITIPVLLFFHFTYKKLHMSLNIFILGIILVILHSIGGPTNIYRMTFFGIEYDKLIHVYGQFVVTLLVYGFVKAHWKATPNVGSIYLFSIVFFVSMGIGALVEIAELGAVLMFGSTGVGEYFNNAFDLVSNAVGALLGSLFMIYRCRK